MRVYLKASETETHSIDCAEFKTGVDSDDQDIVIIFTDNLGGKRRYYFRPHQKFEFIRLDAEVAEIHVKDK